MNNSSLSFISSVTDPLKDPVSETKSKENSILVDKIHQKAQNNSNQNQSKENDTDEVTESTDSTGIQQPERTEILNEQLNLDKMKKRDKKRKSKEDQDEIEKNKSTGTEIKPKSGVEPKITNYNLSKCVEEEKEWYSSSNFKRILDKFINKLDCGKADKEQITRLRSDQNDTQFKTFSDKIESLFKKLNDNSKEYSEIDSMITKDPQKSKSGCNKNQGKESKKKLKNDQLLTDINVPKCDENNIFSPELISSIEILFNSNSLWESALKSKIKNKILNSLSK